MGVEAIALRIPEHGIQITASKDLPTFWEIRCHARRGDSDIWVLRQTPRVDDADDMVKVDFDRSFFETLPFDGCLNLNVHATSGGPISRAASGTTVMPL